LELAASESARPSGSLTLPAISAVFTVTYVAEMLGEDEDWLHELSIDMFTEDSCLRVYGVGQGRRHRLHRLWHRVPEATSSPTKGPPAEPHLPSVAAVFAAC